MAVPMEEHLNPVSKPVANAAPPEAPLEMPTQVLERRTDRARPPLILRLLPRRHA